MAETTSRDGAHAEPFPPVVLIDFNAIPTLCCDARNLHHSLHNRRQFADWFKVRVLQHLFEQGRDYQLASSDSTLNGDRRLRDYWLTLEMAKALCQVERSELGRSLHRHFLGIRQLCAPETESAGFAGQTVETLLPSECQTLRELVDKRSAGYAAHAQARLRSTIWSCVQNQFRVNSYKLIERRQFADACAFIITLERSVIGVMEPGQPLPVIRQVISAEKHQLIQQIIDEISAAMQPHGEIWNQAIWQRICQTLHHPKMEPLYDDQLGHVHAMLEKMIPQIVRVAQLGAQVHADAARRILNNSDQVAPVLASIKQHTQASLENLKTLSARAYITP